jgi:hypothetical protein
MDREEIEAHVVPWVQNGTVIFSDWVSNSQVGKKLRDVITCRALGSSSI